MSLFHLALVLSIVIVWGVNFVAIKIGLQGLPPIFLCFCRFLFCLPALALVKRPSIPLRKIAIYSFVMFVLQFSLLFTAMQSMITPGLASILLQVQSFFAIAFAVLFMGEKYHLLQGAGAACALFGILLIVVHIGGEITMPGLLLVLSTAVMWATGSILVKKMGPASGTSLVAWGSLFACPPLLLASFLFEGKEAIAESLSHLSWQHIGAISYIAYLSTLFGFGLWNWLLQRYPLSTLSPFTLLVPIVGMLSSAMFLGETLPWWKIGAIGLIVGGVGINAFASKTQASAKAEDVPS